MLPGDNRPWAKPLARAVIVASIVAAALGAYYFYDTDDLHIPEVTIIVLLLLTILPPNISIVLRKHVPGAQSEADSINQARLHTR